LRCIHLDHRIFVNDFGDRTPVMVEVHGQGAISLCAAFQATVAAHPELPAIRTLGGPATCWADYGRQVREAAAALAALGLRRGQTLGLMLTNRPEFHVVDAAAMHLGAIPATAPGTGPRSWPGPIRTSTSTRHGGTRGPTTF
jgi:hypothetical protein